MKPLISIITINLNNAIGLKKTIKSVVNQKNNTEFIIIDGKSSDSSTEIVKSFGKKIDHFISEKDLGIYNAMNKGVGIANGKYVYFLNSGDTIFKDDVIKKLSKLINDYNQPDFIYGKSLISFNDKRNNYILQKELNLNKLKKGQKIPQQAYLIKKKLVKKFMFNEKYNLSADFDLLCKVFNEKKFLFIRTNEVICNFNGEGVSSNLKKSYYETYLSLLNNFGKLTGLKYLVLYNIKLLINKLLVVLDLKKYFLRCRAIMNQ